MAARVLLLADSKMVPALAAGLREGGRFEVLTAGTPQQATELLSAEAFQAVVLFYGCAEWTLPAALLALQPAREKGVHLIAVLQKAQQALRDECFRSGASDAFFMPIPKDRFVARLADAVSLAFREEAGLPASVQVASRSTPALLDAATVTPAGIHGAAAVPFQPGQTARLSWKAADESFSSWGLVVSGQPAKVRFAGLTPEEESRLRSWLKATPSSPSVPALPTPLPSSPSVAAIPLPAAPATPTPSSPSAAIALPPPATASAAIALPPPATASAIAPPPTPAAAIALPPPPTASAIAPPPPATASATPPSPGTPAALAHAPQASPASIALPAPAVSKAPFPTPPEGVTPARGAAMIPAAPSAVVAAASAAPQAAASAAPAAGAPDSSAEAALKPAAAGTPSNLNNLFDEQGSPPAAEVPAAAPEALSLGTVWPEPWPTEWCRGAAAAILHDQPLPTGPAAGVAVAKRVLNKVTPTERAAAERPGEAGPSPIADAWTARIALAGAELAGDHLATAGGTVLVDGVALAALINLADAAGDRLQQEANTAIAKGDTEALRVLTGARSQLSQELLAFRKMADKLRGLAAATALGPGELDPEVQLTGRPAPRPRTPAQAEAAALRRSDFTAFDQAPKKNRQGLIAGVLGVLLLAGLLNVAWFSRIRSKEARPGEMDRAGHGIVRIAVTDKRALVVVTPLWAEASNENSKGLFGALAAMNVEQAVVQLADGRPVGIIDVTKKKAFLTAVLPATAQAPPRPPKPDGGVAGPP